MKPRPSTEEDFDLTLPVPAHRLVPHRPPLLLIDRLVEMSGEEAVIEALMTDRNPLIGQSGRIDPLVTLEIMAQAYAAVKGYRDRLNGRTPGKGFLVGVRRFQVSDAPRVGETLSVSVRTVASIDGFAVADATVIRARSLIASATLKLWVPGNDEERKES